MLLKLPADENIPRRLAALLKQYDVNAVHMQDLVDTASKLERTILTRDSDLTTPSLTSLVKTG